MKKLLSIVAAIFFAVTTFAKEGDMKDVTLVTNGTGKTKQEAVNYALRFALERTFGTFVSANTSIINDNLTKDEIVSISTGNIKNYKEISSAVLPNGHYAVVLEATISLSKLTSYAKNHGSRCELAGASFAQNQKLLKMNQANEAKVLSNLWSQLHEIEKNLYDITISAETPRAEDIYMAPNMYDMYVIPIVLTIKGNTNTDAYMNLLFSTLDKISLSAIERADYDKTGNDYSKHSFKITQINNSTDIISTSNGLVRPNGIYSQTIDYYLRGEYNHDRNLKSVQFPPLDLNHMLRELRICVNGISNAYYKLKFDDKLELPIVTYRVGEGEQYRSDKIDKRSTQTQGVQYGNKSKPILPYSIPYGIYNLDAYYAKGKGKKVSYNTIMNIRLELLVSESEMESISNIEIIP